MNKIYHLSSDFKNYSCFNELYDNVKSMFVFKYRGWKNIDLNTYQIVRYELSAADNGKKNYNFDISTFGSGLIIFSEKSINVLKDILEKNGQIVDIITPSKRKKFYGFYPNKNIYPESIINLPKSDFTNYDNGILFRKIVLNNTYPKNDYIFTIETYAMGAFVTEKFKDLVEKNDLKGFDFSNYREIRVED